MLRVFKIYLACLRCKEVKKGHMYDTMSQHVGTTYGPCATGYYCWILGRLSGQRLDHILFLIGLEIWIIDLFDNWIKIDSDLNIDLNLILNWNNLILLERFGEQIISSRFYINSGQI